MWDIVFALQRNNLLSFPPEARICSSKLHFKPQISYLWPTKVWIIWLPALISLKMIDLSLDPLASRFPFQAKLLNKNSTQLGHYALRTLAPLSLSQRRKCGQSLWSHRLPASPHGCSIQWNKRPPLLQLPKVCWLCCCLRSRCKLLYRVLHQCSCLKTSLVSLGSSRPEAQGHRGLYMVLE